jgi:D-3-phosphoglycerate dehydrogenase / 2-oxoglutarate reductase
MTAIRVAITDCHGFPDPGAIERAELGPDVDVVIGSATTEADVVEIAGGADGLMVNLAPVTASVIEQLPRLRVVRYGVGMDNVDVAAAELRGIVALNVPDYCVTEVAHHAVAMISAVARRLVPFSAGVRGGAWAPTLAAPPWPPGEDPVGILGYGRIGRATAAMAGALGHPIWAFDPYLPDYEFDGVRRATSLAELAGIVNHLSIHVPLTDETRGMVDAKVLAALGESGHLVNTARGPVVEQVALLAALDAGTIAWASLDVLPTEPPAGITSVLVRHPRVTATPHIAYLSRASQPRLRQYAARRMRDALRTTAF